MFTQTTTQTMNQYSAAMDTMSTTMAAMSRAQACQNQPTAKNQQNMRQSQAMQTKPLTFTQAENNPVFCFFYSYPPSYTHFNQRPEETLNHARQGGARI